MNVLQDFVTLFLGIIIESLPFVVLGVVISVIVGLFISEKLILSLLPKNRVASHVLISLLGIFVPVCQCGNVPVARRLVLQGLSPSQAMTFLLAAPIVNPITFLATWIAFNSNHMVAISRILAGFFIALTVGLWMSFQKNQKDFLTPAFDKQVCNMPHFAKPSLASAIDIFQNEFILIMKMLCTGAFIAAFIQIVVPRTMLFSIGQNGVLAFLAMLILGFIISICSTVDAFFASSFANSFTTGSLLTFLIFSPLVDLKMLFMMKTTFKLKLLMEILFFVAVVSLIVGMGFNYFNY